MTQPQIFLRFFFHPYGKDSPFPLAAALCGHVTTTAGQRKGVSCTRRQSRLLQQEALFPSRACLQPACASRAVPG